MTRDTATTAVDLAAVTELDIALLHARSAFDRAASAVGVVEHTVMIAGEPVRVRFAGDALLDDLLPAIEHHRAVGEAIPPHLTIHAWDASSTGAPIPHLSTPDAAPTRSVVAGARAASSSGRVMFEGIDAAAGDAWFGVSAPTVLTHGERGAPFRLIFHWWGASRARVLAHAGAVGLDGQGVLIVAPGGGGKSSTSLACVEAGFVYAGDDYCFVASAPEPTAFGLYGSAKVVSDDLACYPSVAREAATRVHETDDKVLLYVSRALPDRMVSSLSLRAVVVPARSDSETSTIEALAPSGALRALAPSTIAQLPGGAATTMRALSAVVRGLPCFMLHLGTDRASVADPIRELIRGIVHVMTVFVSPFHARILRVALLPWRDVEQDWKVLREELDLDTLWEPDAMRMLPLLYRALVDAGVDDGDLPRLKGVVRRTWYDNLVLFHAVGSALDVLEAAGIPAMLLKGVPLALQCYPEVGLRPMADVDMLVEPWRAADAIEVLGGAGWPTESKVTVPDALPYGEQMVHQVVCANEANRQIDLHWRYVPWIARDGSGYDPGLWSAARPFEVAGHTALSPGPDDLLLLVLLHAFRGGWAATPRWIADATLMLRARGPELDWERFTHRVTEGHLALPVREALQFVADEFDAPVPTAALAPLTRARVSPWVRHRYHVASREVTGERRAVIGELDDARTGWARWSINLTPAAVARSAPPFVARRLGLERTRDIPVAVTTRAARNLRTVLRGPAASGAVQSESANS